MTDFVYSDLDFNFELNDNNDIDLLYDVDAIKQSIRNIVLTIIGERSRYQQPEFGSRVYGFLGEKINNVTALEIGDEIENAIINYEERVTLINVDSEADIENNFYKVSIQYNIKNINYDDEITINLSVLK